MTQEAKYLAYENQIFTGIIDKCHEKSFSLVYNLAIIQAKKATSCLLVPEVGDKVAFLQVQEGEYYILHILEREQSIGKLLLPNHTSIEQETTNSKEYPHTNEINKEGSKLKLYTKYKPTHLNIQSDTCTILASSHINLHSENIKSCANNLNLTANHTILTGTTLTTRFKSLRTFCDHAIDKIKNYMGFYSKKITKVETLIDIEAKQANMHIEENLRLRSKRASLKSQESVDIDAKHINVG